MIDQPQHQPGPILEGPHAPISAAVAPSSQPFEQPSNQSQQHFAPPHKDPGEGLGIASLVLSIIGFGVVGIILGIISFSQSKKAGYHKNGLALAGVIIGVVYSAIFILAFLVLIAGSAVSNSGSTY